jgi:hypothetical protein
MLADRAIRRRCGMAQTGYNLPVTNSVWSLQRGFHTLCCGPFRMLGWLSEADDAVQEA